MPENSVKLSDLVFSDTESRHVVVVGGWPSAGKTTTGALLTGANANLVCVDKEAGLLRMQRQPIDVFRPMAAEHGISAETLVRTLAFEARNAGYEALIDITASHVMDGRDVVIVAPMEGYMGPKNPWRDELERTVATVARETGRPPVIVSYHWLSVSPAVFKERLTWRVEKNAGDAEGKALLANFDAQVKKRESWTQEVDTANVQALDVSALSLVEGAARVMAYHHAKGQVAKPGDVESLHHTLRAHLLSPRRRAVALLAQLRQA